MPLRIYDCPIGRNKKKRLKSIANSIGTYIKTDENCTKGWTKSIRVRVLMDLREPFTDEIMLEKEDGKTIMLPIKYERLPNICYYCGRVGHVERHRDLKEGNGEDEVTYGFGEWMRASPWRVSVKEGGKGETPR